MSNLVPCSSCGAAVPSGRFCAVCGQVLTALPVGTDVLPAPRPRTTHAPGAALTVAPYHTDTRVGPTFMAAADTLTAPAAQGVTEAPEHLRRRVPSRGYAVAAIVTVVAGALVLGGENQHTITGDMTLYDSDLAGHDLGDSCTGSGGYDDIRRGQQVVVEDQSGRTLATTSLESGQFDGVGCVFTFTLRDVGEADFYRITTGRAVRGDMQYSYEKMVDAEWTVHLSLGDL